jgi:hypothetical protein
MIKISGISIKAYAYPLGGTSEDPKAVTGRPNKTKHVSSLAPAENAKLTSDIKLELSFLLHGVLALGLVKLSVCFLYWQIFAKVVFRRFLIVWMVVIVGWTFAGLLKCGSHLKAGRSLSNWFTEPKKVRKAQLFGVYSGVVQKVDVWHSVECRWMRHIPFSNKVSIIEAKQNLREKMPVCFKWYIEVGRV